VTETSAALKAFLAQRASLIRLAVSIVGDPAEACGRLGHEVAGRGDRTLGTVLGAGAGALAGRAIDRDC